MFEYGYWPRQKTVAERKADAARAIQAASKRGRTLAPIVIEGRKITQTFWGNAWCDNLERYRDFAYRLDRGRSYVRSGSVIDLQLTTGRIEAQVVGSEAKPYQIAIGIEQVTAPRWKAIQRDCAGSIGSLVDLLAGKLSEAVMARLCVEETGLFPTPAEIDFDCSCPDAATMCKHVAAVMYGVGARLDAKPELLFTMRKVSADELLAAATREMPSARPAPDAGRVLADAGLSALFGIDLGSTSEPEVAAVAPVMATAAKPSVTKASVTKASVTKASATKAIAAKPMVANPTVAKPIATKPTVTKPIAAKPVTARKTPAPIAATTTTASRRPPIATTASRRAPIAATTTTASRRPPIAATTTTASRRAPIAATTTAARRPRRAD